MGVSFSAEGIVHGSNLGLAAATFLLTDGRDDGRHLLRA